MICSRGVLGRSGMGLRCGWRSPWCIQRAINTDMSNLIIASTGTPWLPYLQPLIQVRLLFSYQIHTENMGEAHLFQEEDNLAVADGSCLCHLYTQPHCHAALIRSTAFILVPGLSLLFTLLGSVSHSEHWRSTLHAPRFIQALLA